MSKSIIACTPDTTATPDSGANVVRISQVEDLHWHAIPAETIVLLDCREQGCFMNSTVHLLSWGDTPMHTAHELREDDGDLRIEVVKFPVSDECSATDPLNGVWRVTGCLTDDSSELTPARVERFNVHYRNASVLAAELNEAAL